ncbi:MAG: MBOAT family O-acyltransferase, partial [Gemmiger qucibialis]
YNTLMPQLEAAPKTFETQRLVSGLQRSAWGYFKKFAIADRAAIVVSAAFADPASFDRSQLIFATVMYSFQLYADFSGYTDIVLGMGEILGLHLPENFRQPFFSASVKELWARWHISLSQWFRDYVYIPLGGNRKGIARRDANLLLTFLVSGLWHGANWTFLVWGGLHGLCQVAEDHMPAPLRKRKSLPLRIVGVPLTFAIFVTTFTIFRTSSLGNAAAYFAGILHNPGHEVFAQYWLLGLTSKLELLLLLLGIALLVLVDVLHECGLHLRAWVNAAPRPVRWAVYEFAIFAFLLMASFYSNTGFLYARF